MFELEGTKHEKVVLVLLAYIIGITSGFIAFSPQPQYGPVVHGSAYSSVATYQKDKQSVPVSASDTMPGNETVLGEVSESDEFVYYSDKRLFIEAPEGRMLLSIHVDEVGTDLGEEFATQGTHVREPLFSVNETETNVFFCEFMNSEKECGAYVYDVNENTIRPVAVNGEHLILTDTEAATATWTGSSLEIGNLVSATQEPWLLTLQ